VRRAIGCRPLRETALRLGRALALALGRDRAARAPDHQCRARVDAPLLTDRRFEARAERPQNLMMTAGRRPRSWVLTALCIVEFYCGDRRTERPATRHPKLADDCGLHEHRNSDVGGQGSSLGEGTPCALALRVSLRVARAERDHLGAARAAASQLRHHRPQATVAALVTGLARCPATGERAPALGQRPEPMGS
jgi:hypothetical protein